jgi:hypothetical protein
MPTKHKPSLDHRPFDILAAYDEIRGELESHRRLILEVIGFTSEYGAPEDLAERALTEFDSDAGELLDEIAGVLTKAGAVAIDAGNKPPRAVLANLQVIARDPSLLLRRRFRIEPSTLGMLAVHYQRGSEPPGTLWWEMTGDRRLRPTTHAIRKAARAAIETIERDLRSSKHRRPKKREIEVLVLELAPIFRRFQDGPVRRRVTTEGGSDSSRIGGHEYGPFMEFLDLVLPALENALTSYFPAGYRVSRENLVRTVVEAQKDEKSTCYHRREVSWGEAMKLRESARKR